MEENCKMKYRGPEEKRTLMSRLNRIGGQVEGIKKMLEADRYCEDILIQVSAVTNALKGFAAVLLENHMHTCVVESIQNGDLEIVDELVDLFKKFE